TFSFSSALWECALRVIFVIRFLTSGVVFFFFFFQAEDGIRDRNVTGVQTCALPILHAVSLALGKKFFRKFSVRNHDIHIRESARSEERRVGKECRSRRSLDDCKRNREERGVMVFMGISVSIASVMGAVMFCTTGVVF